MENTKNSFKSEELGVLAVDAGDVVCFSMDSVLQIAKQLKRGFGNPKLKTAQEQSDDLDAFIEENKGIPCDFRADGGYGVSKVHLVTPEGESYDAVLIGGPDGPVRLLPSHLPTFEEIMGDGLDPNWQEKAKTYRDMVIAEVWH